MSCDERQQGAPRRICGDAASGLRITPFSLFPSFHRKWANRRRRSDTGSFNGPIEGLPELIAACQGKESVFAAIVGQEFQSSQIAQVRLQHYHMRSTLKVQMSPKITDAARQFNGSSEILYISQK